jgi:hypothetical protein
MEIPVQFFQSIIGVELAVTGALLFQVRFFEPRVPGAEDVGPDPRLRVLVAVILGATIFGSLDAIAHHGGPQSAMFVTVGAAVSVIPIVIRILPPLIVDAHPGGKRAYSAVTIVGLGLYAGAITLVVFLLGR